MLTWYASYAAKPRSVDPDEAPRTTEAYWQAWARRCTYAGQRRDAVMGSLLTLQALTYRPSGGNVAAPTTSLPEALGGTRNWDYRYWWLRDATLTLYVLLSAGYADEARAWRQWLLRACAGNAAEMQILYGIGGERRIHEVELEWLPGFAGSKPVRVGNGAADQLQLDVYGEVMDCLQQARRHGVAAADDAWQLQRQLVGFVGEHWDARDEGIWEVRGAPSRSTRARC